MLKTILDFDRDEDGTFHWSGTWTRYKPGEEVVTERKKRRPERSPYLEEAVANMLIDILEDIENV